MKIYGIPAGWTLLWRRIFKPLSLAELFPVLRGVNQRAPASFAVSTVLKIKAGGLRSRFYPSQIRSLARKREYSIKAFMKEIAEIRNSRSGFTLNTDQSVSKSVQLQAMIRCLTFLVFLGTCCLGQAVDRHLPDPPTYEWTIKQAHCELARVDFENATIEDAINFLRADELTPLKLRHELPRKTLDIKVNWKLRDILWIDLLAKIADVTDADFIVGRGIITLKSRE